MARLHVDEPIPSPGGEYVPEAQSLDESTLPLPTLAPNVPFYLMTHPSRVCVVEGVVVPLCGRLALKAAVNGIRLAPRTGKIIDGAAVAEFQARGWTIIPPLADGKSNLRRVTVPGGFYFCTRWETPHSASDHVTSDLKGYAQYLRQLMAAGVIPPLQPFALTRLRSKIVQEIQGLEDQIHAQPSLRGRLDRLRADLAAVESELAQARGPGAPSQAFDPADLTADGSAS